MGVDQKDVLQKAVHLHAIAVGATAIIVASDVQLIVLAASDADNARTLAELVEYVAGECLITDVGVAKEEILAVARQLPANLAVVCGTPDADAGGGIEAARPDLFVGRTWLLGSEASDRRHLDRLESFVRGLGATPAP